MTTTLLGYIGPETTLPLMSVLASIVGAFLMFGRSIIHFAKRGVRLVWRKRTPDPDRWRRSSQEADQIVPGESRSDG